MAKLREFYKLRPIEERFLGMLVAGTKHNSDKTALVGNLGQAKERYGIATVPELRDGAGLALQNGWAKMVGTPPREKYTLTSAGEDYYRANLADAEPKLEVESSITPVRDVPPEKPYSYVRKQTSNNRGTGVFDFYVKRAPAECFVGLLDSMPTKSCMISNVQRIKERYALMNAEAFHTAGQVAADNGWVERTKIAGGTKYTLTDAGQAHYNAHIKDLFAESVKSGRSGAPLSV